MGNLVKRSNGKLSVEKTSRQQSGIVIADMLERAAARTAKELTIAETQDWLEFLEREPGPAIRWAFMEHAKLSEFFPKPAEILGLIRMWHSSAEEDRSARQREEEKAEEAARIASGERMYSFTDVLAEFKNLIASKTDLTPERKNELRQKVEDLRKGKLA